MAVTSNLSHRPSRRITRRGFVCGAVAGALALTVPSLFGCGTTGPSTKARDLQDALAVGSDEVFAFTDSAGRTVALARDITRIAPSGSYAQILLCTLCPEKLISLSSRFSETQAHYLGKSLLDLPVLGRYYGRNADMSYEEMIRANPDVIIDVGEAKPNIANDMDGLSEQCGLPVIFVEATTPNIARAYELLGEALGVQKAASELSMWATEVLDFAAKHRQEVASRNIKVLYGSGEYGLDVVECGSVHSGAIDLLGADNVAVLGDTNSTLVSIEQVMNWAPDVVLLSPAEGFYLDIYEDETWGSVPAVQNGRVFEVPGKPYEWLNRPPSVQTLLGLLWLGNLLAPDIYDFDIVKKAQEFYRLFWHYELSEAEAREFMANSTFATAASGQVSSR